MCLIEHQGNHFISSLPLQAMVRVSPTKNESSSGFIMNTFPLDVDVVNVAVIVDVAVVIDVDTPNKYTNNTIFFHILT